MVASNFNKIWLYRIVHIDNIEYLLKHGMFNKSHEQADPNYKSIGDSNLILQRNDYSVGINPPNGQLGEYIPFYFGPWSPMLLNIKTGYRGVTKIPQEEIVYICCNIQTIIDCCDLWCFTDGHAKNAITTFFNDITNLNYVDLAIAKGQRWNNIEQDMDRMRKKQAEFLVKFHVPPNCIGNIVAYDDDANEKISKLVNESGHTIKVHTLRKFYY